VIRNLEAFFLECLNHESPIDQVFYCELAQFRHFFRQVIPRVLLAEQAFLWRG
jgi:hypothetical protein